MGHRNYNVAVRAKTDRNGNTIEGLEQLVKRFKKKCEKAGILEDMKKREFYVGKSLKRKLKSKMARQRKLREEAKYAERFPNLKVEK